MNIETPYFDRAHVLVVGDVMLDRYWYGGCSRISPEAPVPIVQVDQAEDRPGGAGNVALNLAALGASVSLVGVVGSDTDGSILREALEQSGVEANLHYSSAHSTITKLRVLSRHQQLLRIDFEQCYAAEDAAHMLPKMQMAIGNIDVVVLSDYAKGTLQDCQALIRLAKQHQLPILVDPKGVDFSRYKGATILTPNFAEFEAVVGECSSEQELEARGARLIQELDLQAILVTRGEQGMSLLRLNLPAQHLPARAQEVFDVTGAGDTVIAALAASLAAGLSLPVATRLANMAAGIVVGKLGTATVSQAELRRATALAQDSQRGIFTQDQLVLAVEDARACGEKIVFTNGCFDLLHAGHVNYLEEARKLGDRLVVAINSDASVKRLKGDARPINTLGRRMVVLAGLEAVDWVVAFDEDTPEHLLELIKPDVLVKGGDYLLGDVVGANIVHAYGGDVHVLGFVDNCSTTAIVDQIKNY